MYVQIHSRNDELPARGGKESWVESEKISCVAMRSAPDLLGNPAWHIGVTALGAWELSSDDRSNTPKYMNEATLLQLSAEDLETIARLATAEVFLSPNSTKVVI